MLRVRASGEEVRRGLEAATRHFEALKAVAGPAAEMALSSQGPEPAAPPEPEDEINRRFRDRLEQAADIRSVSTALRRMCRKCQIELVREGRAYREAL